MNLCHGWIDPVLVTDRRVCLVGAASGGGLRSVLRFFLIVESNAFKACLEFGHPGIYWADATEKCNVAGHLMFAGLTALDSPSPPAAQHADRRGVLVGWHERHHAHHFATPVGMIGSTTCEGYSAE